jgi:hypothetical protein
MSAEEAPELWPFVCPHCEQASNAVVRGRAYWQGDGSQGPPLEWTLVQCNRCHEPTLQWLPDDALQQASPRPPTAEFSVYAACLAVGGASAYLPSYTPRTITHSYDLAFGPRHMRSQRWM